MQTPRHVLLACCLAASTAIAAVEPDPPTWRALRVDLVRSIAGFRRAAAQARLWLEVESLSAQLTLDAENAVLDLDRVAPTRVDAPIDAFDGLPARAAQDAARLTELLDAAARSLSYGDADASRAAIVAADVFAYDSSNLAPCADEIPRVVASFPRRLLAGVDAPLLELRGNFLDQGKAGVAINGLPARIERLSADSIVVQVPRELIAAAQRSAVELRAVVTGLKAVDRSPRALDFLGCNESETSVSVRPLDNSQLLPTAIR